MAHGVSAQNVVSEFSPNGAYFAYSDASGSLQIWETATRARLQQYTPSAHLSETSSCISWAPFRGSSSDQVTPSKKKRKSIECVDNLELIALGTAKGSILLYSRSTNNLYSQLTGGHSAVVNDICWYQEEDKLFSCSSDKYIVEWSIRKSSSNCKWKADDTTVHSICLCHTKRHLLSAGANIKLWDLDTRQIIQIFTGHSSPVFRLLQVNSQTHRRNSETAEDSIFGSYVLSASRDDHHINVWQISSDQKSVKKPVASFAMPDNPSQLSVSCHRRNMLHVCSVSSNGKLVLFEHALNGHAGVLKPDLVINIKTEDDSPMKIQSASFVLESEDSLIIAYGGDSLLLPAFETMQYKEMKSLINGKKKEVALNRERPVVSSVSIESSISKLKNPEISQGVTVIRRNDASVNMLDIQGEQKKPRSFEASVEERLNAMGVFDPPTNGEAKRTPKADSVATLLVQGLHSEDKAMLNNVLQKRDTDVIQQTVQRLPLSIIVPLIKELHKRMGGHAQSALVTRKWLKCVLATHASYLMTLPDRASLLGDLQQTLETRLDVFRKVCHLQGRLDLILSQIESKGRSQEPWKTAPPQLVYKDESTDDEDNDDRLHDQEMLSEDEEEWNEDIEGEDSETSSSDDESKMDVSCSNGNAVKEKKSAKTKKRQLNDVD